MAAVQGQLTRCFPEKKPESLSTLRARKIFVHFLQAKRALLDKMGLKL